MSDRRWDISMRIRKLLDDKGVKAKKASREMQIPETSLYAVINAERLPNTMHLMKIAKYCGVSTDYILFGQKDRK